MKGVFVDVEKSANLCQLIDLDIVGMGRPHM